MGRCVAAARTITALLFAATLSASAQNPGVAAETAGPYLAGTRSVAYAGLPGGNGSVTATVRYPALTAGTNAALNPAGAPYGAIVFGHGYTAAAAHYDALFAHWASHGYVVVALTTEQGAFSGNLPKFVLDFQAAVLGLRAAAQTAGDPLLGAVAADARATAIGHSFGGTASIVTASQAPLLFDGVVSLAAAATSPQGVDVPAATAALAVPALHMGASLDTIVPPSSNLLPIYAATPSTVNRRRIEIAGGTHGRFHQASGLDWLLESPPTITVDEQQRLVRRYSTAFLSTMVAGDPARLDVYLGPTAAADAALSQQATALAEAFLFAAGPAVQGATFSLTAARAANEDALIAVGFTLLPSPLVTPFGDLFVDPTTALLLPTLVLGPGVFGSFTTTFPTIPGLSGAVLPCQALVGSGASFDLSNLWNLAVL